MEDPISVSRIFSRDFFTSVLLEGQVLGEVTHYFWKKEYQSKGAKSDSSINGTNNSSNE